MTPADRVVADAVGAVIAARITAALTACGLLFNAPAAHDAAAIADAEGRRAVADLRRQGWHISPYPTPVPGPEAPDEH